MRIYLVEDDAIKASSIVDVVHESRLSDGVLLFQSFHSGLCAIKNSPPDVLLVDMTLPTFDRAPGSRAGRLRPLGGYELMRKVRGLVPKIVVVTMLEYFGEKGEEIGVAEVEEMCRREFPSEFLGLVRFQLGSRRWREELVGLICES